MNRETDEGPMQEGERNDAQGQPVRGQHSGTSEQAGERAQVGSPADAASSVDGWSRCDFEAALPLYVGGDLDRGDAARVDAWLVAHPEDQESLAASEAAAGVLAHHASVQHELNAPDLWSGIRAELVTSGLIAGSTAGSTAGGSAGGETPILGGPRWFQRKSVAAAAALLLTGSVGVMLMLGGAGAETGTAPVAAAVADAAAGSIAGPTAGLDSADQKLPDAVSAPARFGTSPAVRRPGTGSGNALVASGSGARSPRTAVSGTSERPIDVIAVDSRRGARRGPAVPTTTSGKTQRLRRPEPGEGRLIDEAPKVILWQVTPR